MDTRFVGRTGLQVSELCLGTMTFGTDGGTDEATAHQILDAFVDAGGTFIDTANVYSQGVSEEILGRWLKTHDRDDLVIATKVYGEAAPGELPRGTGRKHVLAEVENCLGTMAGNRSSACSRCTTCSTAARSWSCCRSAGTKA
jgi:aryl-alcohol dehydrogenase-like predicted oxidoreductase